MIDPVQWEKVARRRQSGAELGRARVLEVLSDGEVHGVDWVAERAGLSARTLWDRLRELRKAGLVEWREQLYGCALVRAVP